MTSFSFAKIVVRDLERSVAFYEQVLGMKPVMHFEREDLEEIGLRFPEEEGPAATLVLMKPAGDAPIVLGNGWGPLGFVTPDIAALFALARKLGSRIVEEPKEMQEIGVSVGYIEDPDGHPIEIVQQLGRSEAQRG